MPPDFWKLSQWLGARIGLLASSTLVWEKLWPLSKRRTLGRRITLLCVFLRSLCRMGVQFTTRFSASIVHLPDSFPSS